MESDHAWYCERLVAWRDGELDAIEAKRVDRHCHECEECSAHVARLALIEQWLSAADTIPPASPEEIEQTLAAVEAEVALSPMESFFWRSPGMTPALAAAALLVTIGAGWLLHGTTPNNRQAVHDLEVIGALDVLLVPGIVENPETLEAATLFVDEVVE